MNCKDDEWQQGIAEHPNYLVMSEKIGTPFYRLENALKWKEDFFNFCGIELTIVDLVGYDWELNPNNLQFHSLKAN